MSKSVSRLLASDHGSRGLPVPGPLQLLPREKPSDPFNVKVPHFGAYWGYLGMLEKKMETTIMGIYIRV